jgi:hypothetical protein
VYTQEVIEAFLKGGDIERSGAANGPRLIVERNFRRQLGVVPNLLLSMGQRNWRSVDAGRYRRKRRGPRLSAEESLQQFPLSF